MKGSTLSAAVLLIVCSSSVRADVPECIAPTNCDTSLASCTVGFDCLGSAITMCGNLGQGGDGSSNSACPAFPTAPTVNYCSCQNCVGLINSILYTCNCDNTYVCPEGRLVKCSSILSWLLPSLTPQYACCGSVSGVSGC